MTTPEQTKVENEAIRQALSTPAFVEETRRGAQHLMQDEVQVDESQEIEGESK